MATTLSLPVAPSDRATILRFGAGDDRKAKTYLLALYGFLASKPENTARAYRYAIREFFELWEWKSPEDITVAEAAYYKKWLKNAEKSDATICQRLAALQSFFKFLMEPTGASSKALISSNPFALITRRDVTPSPYGRSSPIAWPDFEKILDSIPDDIAGKRDRAMLLFFAWTGRRRAEVANLRVRDLNLRTDPRTYTTKVKGGETKTWSLPDICYDAIRDHWISANRLKTLRPDSAVFGTIVTSGGSYYERDPHRPLTVDQVAKILKRNAKRAGLDPRKFKLHGIRHMFAQQLDAGGETLQTIQEQLGHKGPAPTVIYIGKLRGPPKSVESQLAKIRAQAARQAADAIDD